MTTYTPRHASRQRFADVDRATMERDRDLRHEVTDALIDSNAPRRLGHDPRYDCHICGKRNGHAL
jgi:hypothetical protein